MQKHLKQSPRHIAVNTLCRLYETRLPVKPLLEQACRKQMLPTRDRNLAMQLVYGVLRHRQSLDRILELLSSTPLAKLDPFVHQCLIVGLYQLFFLRKIPDSAAVNEMVKCSRAAGKPKRLQGFINGNLRGALRRKDELFHASQKRTDGKPVYNHPNWLTDRWAKTYGKPVMEDICAANNHEPRLVLRVNTSRITVQELCSLFQAHDISCREGKYSPEALVLKEFRGAIPTLPGFDEGFFQVQDEATQLASRILFPLKQRGRYLDGCAGLGGKTTHLVQLTHGLSPAIHAVEPNPHRLNRLQENLLRLFGTNDVILHPVSLQEAALEFTDIFDGILLDAPCSGTGVIGRHPDIRWNRREEDLKHYSALQLELLNAASRALRPGGVLVHATSSLDPKENILIIDSFLADNPSFKLTDCSEMLPPACREFVIDNCFQPLPSEEIDGFFCARLHKN